MLAIVAMAIGLAGCVDDDGERRFATDPRPDETPEFVPSSPVAPPSLPTSTPVILLAAADLLAPAGGPPMSAFVADGAAYVIDPAAGAVFQAVIPTGGEVVAATAGGFGQAALVRREVGGRARYDLVVLDPVGAVTRTIVGVTDPLGAVGTGSGRDLLAGSDDGSRFVVMPRSGGAVYIEGEVAPRMLVEPARAAEPAALALTADGSAVLYAAAVAGAPTQLWVSSLRALPIDPVQVIDGDASTSVRTAAWAPDGSGVYFVDERPGAVAGGGDVYFAPRRTLDGELVVSANRVAPVAEILAIAPAPDGESIAYAAITPDYAVSVWVQQIGSANAVRVGIDGDAPLAGISWTASGLVVVLIDAGQVRAMLVTSDGSLRDIGAASLPATVTPTATATVPPTVTSTRTSTLAPSATATTAPAATNTPTPATPTPTV